jgi:hypothetical protein
VGREVRLSAARSDGGRDRGVQLPMPQLFIIFFFA